MDGVVRVLKKLEGDRFYGPSNGATYPQGYERHSPLEISGGGTVHPCDIQGEKIALCDVGSQREEIAALAEGLRSADSRVAQIRAIGSFCKSPACRVLRRRAEEKLRKDPESFLRVIAALGIF